MEISLNRTVTSTKARILHSTSGQTCPDACLKWTMIKNMFSDAGAPLVWIHVQQASSTATKKQDTHEKNGGVSFCPADAQRQQRYDVIERHATPFQVPVFYHADHPHDRLYIACLDGTGNEIHDALHATPDLRNVNATIP